MDEIRARRSSIGYPLLKTPKTDGRNSSALHAGHPLALTTLRINLAGMRPESGAGVDCDSGTAERARESPREHSKKDE
ncbi:hypothetical protein QE152_g8974 [Popillia japonica]|uniref:Uncharacterized protein n=1 Tax=Popillia japonica TaxID=7064 RepID=A0AAW1LWD0_POPJA